MQYFLIHHSDDGDTHIESKSLRELSKEISKELYGENENFADKLPAGYDVNYWGNVYIIIKGEILTPSQLLKEK